MINENENLWKNPLFDYEDWVEPIHKLLEKLDLKHYAYQNENKINILHVPEEMTQTILNYTQKMGLVLHCDVKETIIYTGVLQRERKPVGFEDQTKTFTIYRPPENSGIDLSQMVFTLERR